MVEAASWEKESKYVCVSWLQMNLGMNINVYDNMRIITAVLFTSLPKTLRDREMLNHENMIGINDSFSVSHWPTIPPTQQRA